jgi:chromosomal replication initiation ATPase DnaA
MTNLSQEGWIRVKERVRAELGDDIYASWFERLNLEDVTNSAGPDGAGYTAHLSVPTRFLKSWIQSHYGEHVLAALQAESPAVIAYKLDVRSGILRDDSKRQEPAAPGPSASCKQAERVPVPLVAPVSALSRTLRGSRLDPRLTFDTFMVGRSNTLAHAAAKREIRDFLRGSLEPRRVKIDDIQQAVARRYNCTRADLLSPQRTHDIVRPRQIAMYLAKHLTLQSLPEIGRRFGGRDHTTILHAVRKIEDLVKSDPALAREIEELKREIKQA